MSITISVPNDDHVALRAMAKALEEIAVARGAPARGISVSNHFSITQDETWKKAHGLDEVSLQRAQHHGDYDFNVSDETIKDSQQVKSLSHGVPVVQDFGGSEPVGDPTKAPASDTDSTDTQWDERIHSASKALNSDGTWRLRRKPADKTPEEWTAYVKWVEEDIHTVMHGQSEDKQEQAMQELVDTTQAMGLYDIEPSVTPLGDDFHVDAGEVTEQQIAAIPAPPLPPVANIQVGSPLPPAETIYVNKQPYGTLKPVEAAMTFPQVMQFLTERHGRITSAQVDDIIADMGLNSIMDLNTQPEHTGPFIARVKALLGE